MTRWTRFVLAVLALLSATASPSWAQPPSTIVSQLARVSSNVAVIRSQLVLASQLAGRALEQLQATASDSRPDPSVVQAATDAYVLIRAARAGMELSQAARRFPDPLIELAYTKTTRAWNLARGPVDRASWGMSASAYRDAAIKQLSEAVALLHEVLVLLP